MICIWVEQKHLSQLFGTKAMGKTKYGPNCVQNKPLLFGFFLGEGIGVEAESQVYVRQIL
jgi:hypothetical protein